MRVQVNSKAQNVRFEKTDLNDWREVVASIKLKSGTNKFYLTNSGAIKMYIDQITFEPAETEREKFDVTVREAEFGSVSADVEEAVAGQTVTLTATPEGSYGLKALKLVNSIFFTEDRRIDFEKGTNVVTFTMPDDNAVIQPVFYDMCAEYELDFTNVAAGALPEGWRTTDGTSVRDYPTQNSSGPRTMIGFVGYQGKALYWRTTSAEYGRQSSYRMNLTAGEYELIFAMAAWKGTPTYQASILNSSGTAIATSSNLTARPNINGNNAGDISSAVRQSLKFEVTKAGSYIIQFKEVGSGMQEFLLAECRVRNLSEVVGIQGIDVAERSQQSIYTTSGLRIQQLQRGLNILVGSDGKGRKVIVK